jgi:hypothetical protein
MEDIAEVEGKTLIIRLPLQKPVPSKASGKTLVIASTHGVVTTAARHRGRPIVVVANAFVYPTTEKELHGGQVAAEPSAKAGRQK